MLESNGVSNSKHQNEEIHVQTRAVFEVCIEHIPKQQCALAFSTNIFRTHALDLAESALAYWLERRTPNRETWVRSSAGSVCCFLEQETFTPQKNW